MKPLPFKVEFRCGSNTCDQKFKTELIHDEEIGTDVFVRSGKPTFECKCSKKGCDFKSKYVTPSFALSVSKMNERSSIGLKAMRKEFGYQHPWGFGSTYRDDIFAGKDATPELKRSFGLAVISGEQVPLYRGDDRFDYAIKGGITPDMPTEDVGDDAWLFHGKRVLVDIHFKQINTVKCKWGDTSVSYTGQVTIWLNKVEVYSFGARDYEYGLAKAQVVITQLMEHSIQWWRLNEPDYRKEVIGQKVYYDKTPAIIKDLFLDQGCVYAEVDVEACKKLGMKPEFPPSVYVLEDTNFDLEEAQRDNEWRTTVKDDLFADKWWWHRKAPELPYVIKLKHEDGDKVTYWKLGGHQPDHAMVAVPNLADATRLSDDKEHEIVYRLREHLNPLGIGVQSVKYDEEVARLAGVEDDGQGDSTTAKEGE